MRFEQDWVLRQIQMLVQFIVRIVFGKDTADYIIEDELAMTGTDLLYLKLKAFIKERNICEAEDLLFKYIDKGNMKVLEAALYFYNAVNELDDEEMKSCNFERNEISEGLNEVIRIYGLPC